ncbi:MAG: 30S ribosomal protein S2 [Crocinitomicaceae bacterium]|nr:30S ribosomal protein S2 [Crocinitomicaceae bacterium]|tara:strand:+ start:5197 stop:6117 length:921 start_codon:yes stop_codon:yes gene_type:complete
MSKANFETLLEAGVHFGHLKRKWNPAMAPYIFEEKKGIHIIDLNKTIAHLDQASAALKQIAQSGKKILFVATKKQAKDLLAERVKEINMPYVTERWTGGMLTNFQTTRKSIRKMTAIDKMQTDGTWETLNKRERLFKTRQREKLDKNFGSIADMTRQPAAIFIVDILKEHIALKEARRLSIPVFAMVDTNSNPSMVDFPIPANDDASKSIQVILDAVCGAVKEGLSERKASKEAAKKDAPKKEEVKSEEVKAEAPAKEEAKAEAPKKEAKKKAEPKAKKVEAETKEEAPAAEEVEVEATDDAKEAK